MNSVEKMDEMWVGYLEMIRVDKLGLTMVLMLDKR
jgi:hypothetical protein